MNTQTQTRAQVQKASAPTMTPLKSNLLQRTCACGEAPGIDGLCSDCRDKRLASPHTPPLATAPPLLQVKPRLPAQAPTPGTNLINPNTGHNFSRLPIHAPLPKGLHCLLPGLLLQPVPSLSHPSVTISALSLSESPLLLP